MIPIEVCVDSLESAINAINGGANRLEICGPLELGGVTPSIGLVQKIASRAAAASVEACIMIRPRAGHFIFSDTELEVMLADIHAMKTIQGVTGFVFGTLTESGALDENQMKQLIQASAPLQSVCHRAIDVAKDPLQALEQCKKLGVHRVLTSGAANTAAAGIAVIKQMQDNCGSVCIMAGSGVNPGNVLSIVEQTGVQAVHLSAKTAKAPPKLEQPKCDQGLAQDGFVHYIASEETVRAVRVQLK
eukprot:TRINITY_DN22427_c0_g1_i1.p1 TRINITY_DN22427_c0_g1~~TRINITY_DN22427_c0_g1_i1.p1  ORF type:complete len:246 (+),score=35.61 TRINITY_DN22427_c0_g1_i1:66-803(+)